METNARRQTPLPRFTGGMILGFGLMILLGLVVFRSARRTPVAETACAPSIRLTSPESGTLYQAPADISIEARVEPSRGPAIVEFYHGPIKIGESAAPPYRCTWKGLRYPGHYQLSARLAGASGLAAESPTVWVQIDRDPAAGEAISAPSPERR